MLNVAAERVQGRQYGGPAAGGGICEDVKSMNYARASVYSRIYTWYDLVRPTQRCDMHACDKISHFQLPRPQNGGARAYSNLGQPILLKDPYFVGTCRYLKHSYARDIEPV